MRSINYISSLDYFKFRKHEKTVMHLRVKIETEMHLHLTWAGRAQWNKSSARLSESNLSARIAAEVHGSA